MFQNSSSSHIPSAHLCLFFIPSQHLGEAKCLHLTIKKHQMMSQLTLQIKETLKSGLLHPLLIQVPNSGPRRVLLRHRPGRSMWHARLQLSRSLVSLQWMEDWQPGWSYSLPFSSRHCLWVGNTRPNAFYAFQLIHLNSRFPSNLRRLPKLL